jgi:hypothetical protein
MTQQMPFEVLSSHSGQALIYTESPKLMSYLDKRDTHVFSDYYQGNQLIARSYRIHKSYLPHLKNRFQS